MKITRNTFLIVFISFSADLLSQRLTNREIFSFETGDIIHVGLQTQSPPVYIKRKFLTKTVSSNNDTIFYSVLDSTYNLNSTFNWELQINSNEIFYTDLDTFPSPDIDTSYIDACGSVVNFDYYTIPDTVFFEGEHFEITSYKGLGKYLYYRNDFSQNGNESRTWLIFYCKNGSCCGERIKNLSINSLNLIGNLNIYPNPGEDFIQVHNDLSGTITFYTTMGNQILQTEKTENIISINIHDFPPGIYFIVLETEAGRFIQKFIKV